MVPATLAATVGAYFGLSLVTHLARVINIVPQEGLLDLVLASVGINGVTAAAGVFAGTKTAPRHRRTTAITVAILLGAMGLTSVILGAIFREHLRAPLGWHALSSVAWVAGAVVAALALAKHYEHE